MSNKSNIITGSIHIYLFSTIVFYSFAMFTFENFNYISFALRFLHMVVGAIIVYVINYCMHNNLKKGITIAVNAVCFVLYSFAAQFLIYKSIQMCNLCICAFLYFVAVYLNYKEVKRMRSVVIFELSAVVLLLAAFIIDVKFDVDINIIPVVVSVTLGLIEVSRINAAEKGQIILVDILIYFVCIGSAFLIVSLREWIVLLIKYSISGVEQAGHMLINAVKQFFLTIYVFFDSKSLIYNYTENKQDYSKGPFDIWMLIILGGILLAAVIIGIVALIKKNREKDKGLKYNKIKILERKKRAYQTTIATKQGANKSIKKNKRINRVRWLLKSPDDPQIFIYKLNRIFRKTDYCLKKNETPRQYLNKILEQSFVTEELRIDLKMIIEDIDIYYYSDKKNLSKYEKEMGKKLLKKLKKCMKKQCKLRFL